MHVVARRLSRKKQKLTEIQLLAPARNERPSPTGLTFSDAQNNAFGSHFRALVQAARSRKLLHNSASISHGYRKFVIALEFRGDTSRKNLFST